MKNMYKKEKIINYREMKNQDIDYINKQNKILKSIPMMKCLMILAIKKYTWTNELKTHFGIFGKDIDKFKTLMTEMGYINHKLIWEIPDEVAYYAMISMVNIGNQAQIMALTPDGEEWSKEAINYIAKESNNNQSLRLAFEYVLQRTAAFKKRYKEIEKIETTKLNRYIEHRGSRGQIVLENRRTILGKQIDKETKISLAENKLLHLNYAKQQELLDKAGIDETLLLEHTTNNKLVINFNNKIQLTQKQALLILGEKNKKTKSPKIKYNGMYNYLTNSELEKLSSKIITDKEEKEMKKNGYIGFTDKRELQKLNNRYRGLKLKSYHCEEEYIGKKDIPEKKDIFDLLGIDE